MKTSCKCAYVVHLAVQTLGQGLTTCPVKKFETLHHFLDDKINDKSLILTVVPY